MNGAKGEVNCNSETICAGAGVVSHSDAAAALQLQTRRNLRGAARLLGEWDPNKATPRYLSY